MGIIGTEEQHGNPELDADFVAVAVYTTSGAYPSGGHERVKITETVSEVLSKAASALKLTDTSDWVATVDGSEIDPSKSYEANELKGAFTVQWGPRETGGGC